MSKDGVLEEGVQGAEADESSCAGWRRLFDATFDVIMWHLDGDGTG